ncbi:hypothetical protein JVU11DRAFT_7969 [Chiua virens]|nr:hypothetical protein JVU11DRAFT_7969 [Chiua virens]
MSNPNLPNASQPIPLASQTVSEPTSCPDKASLVKESREEGCTSDLVDEEEAEEQLAFTWARVFLGKRRLPRDPDAIATRRSVFDNPHLAPYYWPKKDYENIHRFEPSTRWTYREEKASDPGAGLFYSRF